MVTRHGRSPLAVAPTLNAYEVQRLLIVGGCIAAAAAANYADSALPQRVPVALGSAVLGILMVFRRRPALRVDRAHEVVEDPATPADEPHETSEEPTPTPSGRRAGRGARSQLLAMAASLASAERELEAHDARLVSLSGRQSLLQVNARDTLAELDGRLQQLELRIADTEEQMRLIHAHHIDLLKHLNAALADHRQALLELSDTDALDTSH